MSKKTSKSTEFRIKDHPIIEFKKGRRVRFYFEGKELYGYEGEPIAASLIANGIKVFRYTEKKHRPRGFFCAVGKCSSCLMIVNDIPNVMVCVEPLKEGMNVKRQKGRGKLI
ncbi:MAG: (2Fe-2S)-binding protein [candidate division WOR-3 bacterium]|nr:(2Fe-2S)-binding protein [candidate division WOR-3 bacterium]MCX7757716.1 (2Fe-2S)-binding protein [candidate division WOR-3 bacterium]MDW7988095.1 (2Fe-2S)-binding protein [candidate division WOR-3 bacterium]